MIAEIRLGADQKIYASLHTLFRNRPLVGMSDLRAKPIFPKEAASNPSLIASADRKLGSYWQIA